MSKLYYLMLGMYQYSLQQKLRH